LAVSHFGGRKFFNHMSQKRFINIFLIILVVVLAVVVGYFVLRKPDLAPAPQVSTSADNQAQGSSIDSTTSVPNDEIANWKTYRNEKYGFELKYPNSIFIASEKTSNSGTNVGGGVLLQSAFFATDSSGMSGNDYKHFFSIEFFTLEKDLFLSLRDGVGYPPLFIAAFPKGTIESFDPGANSGYIKKLNIAGQEGFTFGNLTLNTSSANGLNAEHVYVEMNAEKTISITFSYISDSLQPKITESQQKEFFSQIISTFKFVK
jgi:hypothetical protein